MTAPPLPAVAGWDLPLLRGATVTLVAVADRLVAWRARTEAVGRSLAGAECWSGPAASVAAEALVAVSEVTAAVSRALAGSLDAARRLLADAARAQELAVAALTSAAAVPVDLDPAGRPGPLPPGAGPDQAAEALRVAERATEALHAATRVALAATEAADALVVLGVGGALAPVSFHDLADVVGAAPLAPVRPPRHAAPAVAAAWWAGLSTTARRAAIEADPAGTGALEGAPAWARDRANRAVLDRALADPDAPGHAGALAVAAEIDHREAAGERVQLLRFEPTEELAALALGDLDTAEAVAVLVPGVGNDVAGDLDALADDAAAVADAARAAAPGLAVAAVAWLGYRPPSIPMAPTPFAADRGGPALDRALDGLAAARAADPAGEGPPRVTVLAHSYGTVVTDRAAEAPGALAADAVVLLGSPGLDNDATGLEAAEVHESSSPFDPISWGEWLGNPTWRSDFRAHELPTDWHTLHDEYYEPYHPTLAAMGEVVAGERGGR